MDVLVLSHVYHLPLYKKVLSYLVPVTIETTIGQNMTVLELKLYYNQWLLATPSAVYSFGRRYKPFRKTFSHIKEDLPHMHSFLLLGTGLGSALKILQDDYQVFPQATLVDNDEDVLGMSLRVMNLNSRSNVDWRCCDALSFMKETDQRFDLICVDIYRELILPDFVKKSEFLSLCRNALTDDGICIMNLIFKNDNEIVSMQKSLQKIFPSVEFILDRVNTYFICRP